MSLSPRWGRGTGVLGEEGPCSPRCGWGRGLPAQQRRCNGGGGGGNRTFPTPATRRHLCPQPCHLLWVLATHPQQSAQCGLVRALWRGAPWGHGRVHPVSSPRVGGEMPGSRTLPGSHLLSPAPRGARAFWGRGDISGGFLLSEGLIHFPLSRQGGMAGKGKAPVLPLSPSLSTLVVWQGHGHGRRRSIAKSALPRAQPVGFVFLPSIR